MTLPLTLILTLSLTRRAALEREGLAKLCHARAIAGPDSSAGVRNTNWEGFQSYHDVFRPASPNYCSELHNLVSASPPPPPHPHPHPHPTPPSPPPFPLTFTLTPTFTLTRCSPRSPGERRDARSRARSVPRCCSSCLFLNPSPDSRPQPSPYPLPEPHPHPHPHPLHVPRRGLAAGGGRAARDVRMAQRQPWPL